MLFPAVRPGFYHPGQLQAPQHILSRRFGPRMAPHRPLNKEIRVFHVVHQEGRDSAYAVRIGYTGAGMYSRRSQDSKPFFVCHPRRYEHPLRAWVYYERFLTISETGGPYICSVHLSGISQWARMKGLDHWDVSWPALGASVERWLVARLRAHIIPHVRSLARGHPYGDTRPKILTRTRCPDIVKSFARRFGVGQSELWRPQLWDGVPGQSYEPKLPFSPANSDAGRHVLLLWRIGSIVVPSQEL
ncbi:hypothetical protein C8R47DRAFT_1068064 [Mycena vitilis]|nr:hypothetical protein C8R47DRAFT_1068064 [Mycena vitilis]